ncbi:hypothetical protein FHL15_001681 [Xylaria flabelliformis]|uniref:Uncharacterized protein n=1 Tax=Xylaria flabelliformis TaxID=2512241 RepID=A0A553IB28_9PEZI|nr:hypothetical protein FHL15_001681 [Xylaria flabelliformis]
MASEPRRPPTRTGSGSRPPTSRFQEGSMNDRASAAPPAQFMGPEQLKNYENQFYTKPPTMYEVRRPRPFSASGKLQGPTPPQHADSQDLQQQQQPQKHTVTHKKSMGFFGRVRDALFHRGGGQNGQAAPKEQDVRRKHSSLQEPVQNSQMPPPPRPQFLQHAGRTQSEVNIAQIFADAPGGTTGDRPSREDVLASYNQLMASGFFQSHAIQSTRHAAPAAAAGLGGRQAPGLPVDNQIAPRPPVRVTSIHATARPTSLSPMPARVPSPSPNPQGRNGRECTSATMAAPRTSLSSLFRPSIPELNTKESRYMLRGRKRTRGEYAPVSPEPQSSSSTSYFTQPLKRVAKKLREMPSSSSQLNEKAAIRKNSPVCVTQEPSDDLTSADGMLRLVPSISNGGSLHPNERPIRLHSPSPSPARPEMTAAGQGAQRSERPFHERAASATRTGRPRRTFSYVVTESPRGRRAAAERERERERERDVRFHLQRRGSSATRPDDNTSKVVTRSSRQTTRSPNPLGQWQRVSLEDTIIHRDSSDSTRSQWDWEWDQRQATEVQIASSPGANKLRKRPTQSPSPLRAVPDVNRSLPKTPERWHYSGKAYHLKDRGSRLELMTGVRHSEDSGKSYGKENDWRRVDADGDIDLLAYENPVPRENNFEEQQLHQWRIGNAL